MPTKLTLLWPFVLTMLIPLGVSYFVYADHLPPNFLVFPPEQIPGSPSFNLIYFIILSLGALGVTALLLFPRLFGFKPATPAPAPTKHKLPWWFYVGLIVMLFFWWLHWSRSFAFGDLVYYAFSPMWWGFIIMLDGIVYRVAGGKSLLVNRTSLFIMSALFSVFGWWYFEFFDYFVLSNWYYPNGHMEALSHTSIVVIFLVAYTTVWPAIFEWYTLLNAFPSWTARWSDGFKINLNGNVLLIVGAAVIAACAAFPYPIFWGVWIGPMAMLTGQLIRLGIWTPFTPLKEGNWSPAILIALASLFNGFLWEFWNHGSEAYNPFNLSGVIEATNPNFWIYNVPYVNVIHIFSEMPLLGYFGYLPFGLFVWVIYIWAGKIFGWRSDLNLSSGLDD